MPVFFQLLEMEQRMKQARSLLSSILYDPKGIDNTQINKLKIVTVSHIKIKWGNRLMTDRVT